MPVDSTVMPLGKRIVRLAGVGGLTEIGMIAGVDASRILLHRQFPNVFMLIPLALQNAEIVNPESSNADKKLSRSCLLYLTISFFLQKYQVVYSIARCT